MSNLRFCWVRRSKSIELSLHRHHHPSLSLTWITTIETASSKTNSWIFYLIRRTHMSCQASTITDSYIKTSETIKWKEISTLRIKWWWIKWMTAWTKTTASMVEISTQTRAAWWWTFLQICQWLITTPTTSHQKLSITLTTTTTATT